MPKMITKKLIAYLVVVSLLVLTIGTLAACSQRLNGKYAYSIGGDNEHGTVFLIFDGSNKMKYEVTNADGSIATSKTCTYTIKNGKILYSKWSDGSKDFEEEFTIDGSDLVFGSTRYIKQ